MKNIKLVNIDKFKSVFVSINFLMPMSADNLSKNALLSCVLKRGNNTYPTEKEINRKLAHLYNASIDVSSDKFKEYVDLKFEFEYINIEKIDPVEIVEFLTDYITNPNISNGQFDEKIVERERAALLERISEEKDNKRKYALEELNKMLFEGEDYAISVLGEEDAIRKITNKELADYYYFLLKNSQIVVNVVGNLKNSEHIVQDIYTDLSLSLKNNRKAEIEMNIDSYRPSVKIKEKEETQQIAQSVLAIGAKIVDVKKEDIFALLVYNQILGGNPASLMFQNVREKNSLAYFAKSMYNRQRQTISTFAGIEPKNYEKAKKIMMEQFDIMKTGEFSNTQFVASVDTLVSSLKDIYDSKEELQKMLFTNELFFGREVGIDEMVQNIQKVTKEEVITIAGKVFIDSIFCLGGVSDE